MLPCQRIYLTQCCKKKIKQNLIRHGKNTNKIRETHIFWWYFSNYGEIRQDVVSYNRLHFRFAQQSVWLSIQRDNPFSDVRIFLWRVMCRRRDLTPYGNTLLTPHLRTCSADTILRAIRELTTPNLTYRYGPSNLILGSRKSSWPFAYCLKSHHGVRGFCLLRLCTIRMLYENESFQKDIRNLRYQKYYRLRIFGYII